MTVFSKVYTLLSNVGLLVTSAGQLLIASMSNKQKTGCQRNEHIQWNTLCLIYLCNASSVCTRQHLIWKRSTCLLGDVQIAMWNAPTATFGGGGGEVGILPSVAYFIITARVLQLKVIIVAHRFDDNLPTVLILWLELPIFSNCHLYLVLVCNWQLAIFLVIREEPSYLFSCAID